LVGIAQNDYPMFQQHLAAINMLFERHVAGQVMLMNRRMLLVFRDTALR